MKRRAFLLSSVACSVLSTATARAIGHLPETHTWPTDPAPCDAGHTLQQCIDSAFSGDTVQIATNGPIEETISFTKELTLSAATGFQPVFSPANSIVASTSASGDQTIRIEGLDLEGGGIRVEAGAANLTAQIIDNVVGTSADANDQPGITVDGAVSFAVSGNELFVKENGSQSQTGISVAPSSLAAEGTIDHNFVVMDPGSQSDAILLVNLEDTDFTVDVIANRVSGTGYDDGIDVKQLENGTTTTRILENLVTGEAGDSGFPCGIVVSGWSGSLEAMIANNTLAYDACGIGASTAAGVSASVAVANNVIASSSSEGLDLAYLDPATSVTERNDLFFANAIDIAPHSPVTAGPGTIMADPLFAGRGDYRLEPGSPAIDAGDDASVPADLTTDLGGSPRIQGAHVDIGAYEAAPEPATAFGALASLALMAALQGRRGRFKRWGWSR